MSVFCSMTYNMSNVILKLFMFMPFSLYVELQNQIVWSCYDKLNSNDFASFYIIKAIYCDNKTFHAIRLENRQSFIVWSTLRIIAYHQIVLAFFSFYFSNNKFWNKLLYHFATANREIEDKMLYVIYILLIHLHDSLSREYNTFISACL